MLVNRTLGHVAASVALTLSSIGCAVGGANDEPASGDSAGAAAASAPAVQSSNGTVELAERAALHSEPHARFW